MKRWIVAAVVIAVTLGISIPSYASDWDKAGKVLAVVEGARILTGGNVDIIGNITGINKGGWNSQQRDTNNHRYARANRRPAKRRCPSNHVWVTEYVPEHQEYRPGYGNVIVEGHYVRYAVVDNSCR